jgi:hypothetical protein
VESLSSNPSAAKKKEEEFLQDSGSVVLISSPTPQKLYLEMFLLSIHFCWPGSVEFHTWISMRQIECYFWDTLFILLLFVYYFYTM